MTQTPVLIPYDQLIRDLDIGYSTAAEVCQLMVTDDPDWLRLSTGEKAVCRWAVSMYGAGVGDLNIQATLGAMDRTWQARCIAALFVERVMRP